MPSTYANNLRLENIANGEQSGAWGDTTNKNICSLLVDAVAGYAYTSISGLSFYTPTAFNGLSDESRKTVLKYGGLISAACTIYIPPSVKVYIIDNSTTNPVAPYTVQNLLIRTAAGALAATVPSGIYTVYCDGLDTFISTQWTAGGTIAGNLAVTGTESIIGNVGIGTAITANAKLTVNANTVLPATAPIGGTNFWVVGADTTNNRFTIDSFGALSNISFRRAQGTAAAPTALIADIAIANLAGFGYGATGYSTGGRANIQFTTAENWTDIAQGAYISFATAAIGTVLNLEKMRLADNGNLGIGTTTTAKAKLTVNANTVLPATAPPTGTNLWVTGADATANRITLDSFGSFSSLGFRQSAGTAAAPTAVTSGAALANIVGYGYGATGYTTTGRATINFLIAENWTDTAQGTSQAFYTTAIGTTTQTEKVRIDGSGNTYIESGNLWQYTPTPTALAAGANTTVNAGGLYTSAQTVAVTLTVPTGTDIDAAIPSVPTTDIGVDFYIINTGTAAGAVTVVVNTGITSVGSLVVAIGTSGRFRLRRTGVAAYIIYRLG